MLRKLENIAERMAIITSAIARVCLLSVALILFVQVVLRYGFSSALPWPEEASRYLIIWVVMLSGSLLVKDEQLVRVDFFDHFWPKRILGYRNAIFRILLAVMLAVLVWKGAENAIFGLRRQSTTIGISFFWIYLAVPVGAALMMIHMTILALRDIVRGSEDPKSSVLKSEG